MLTPSPVLRRLGLILTALRKDQGRTLAEVAAALHWSHSKLSRIEAGKTRIPFWDLPRLLDELQATDPGVRDACERLLRAAYQPGWWTDHSDAVSDVYAAYLDLEAAATVIRTYQSMVVPGLLQTKEYARAVIASIAPHLTSDQVEARVAVRMRRQQGAGRPEGPPRLWAIIDEAVLRRQVGGREVMTGQLAHLRDVARLANVTLQVLPFERGLHPGIGPLTHLTFPSDPEAAYVESVAGQTILHEEARVAPIRVVFEELISVALPVDRSVDMIDELLKEAVQDR